jgi:hypothetical protein
LSTATAEDSTRVLEKLRDKNIDRAQYAFTVYITEENPCPITLTIPDKDVQLKDFFPAAGTYCIKVVTFIILVSHVT